MWTHPRRLLWGLVGLPVLGVAAASKTDSFESACDAIKDKINIENAKVGIVEYVPAGENVTFVGIPAVCSRTPPRPAVDLCRVYMDVSTSESSAVRLEAWLPRDFNGRFLSIGNGGLGGCVDDSIMSFGSRFGFATVGTNNGHDGDTGEYFLGNSEVMEDYVYRSIVTGASVGKEVTKLFYDKGFNKSYFMGCSTGGRQGYKSAQSFPELFDGILAGAPAMNFVNLQSWGAYAAYITGGRDDPTYLTPAQWAAVHEEVLRQCDKIDGAEDGILEDPDLCRPVVETLICNATCSNKPTSTCLTGLQAKTVTTLLNDYYGPDGTLYYPRFTPGNEVVASLIYFSGSMFRYSVDWFRYAVLNDSTWDPTTWKPQDASLALAQNPFNLQTYDADLSAFRARGGKLLSYHGTSDPIISSDDTKLYYRKLADTMSLSPTRIDEFYRFFGISGMGHCSPDIGAAYIGQGSSTYLESEPENNLLLKLVDWVENGVAPEYIRGSKVAPDGKTAEYSRKHCRYPRRNTYVGPGDYTDEESWQCV